MKKTLLIFSLVLLLLPNLSNASPAEQRLRGKILLQVEQNGEAWYVRPDDGMRMYMKDGDAAYNLMRNYSLGISNLDLSKIPIGFEDRFECLDSDADGLCDKLEIGLGTEPNNSDSDGDGYDDGTEIKNNYDPLSNGKLNYDLNLADRLRGKILLQVENNGEAWYIHPDDGKRYYMPDGDSAYQIMRFLSLGITDNDLAMIDADGDIPVDDNEISWVEYNNPYLDFTINYPSNFEIEEETDESSMEDDEVGVSFIGESFIESIVAVKDKKSLEQENISSLEEVEDLLHNEYDEEPDVDLVIDRAYLGELEYVYLGISSEGVLQKAYYTIQNNEFYYVVFISIDSSKQNFDFAEDMVKTFRIK